MDLPVELNEHHIVKDKTFGFSCLKCQLMGPLENLRASDCAYPTLARLHGKPCASAAAKHDAVSKAVVDSQASAAAGADLASTEKTLQTLQDEELALELLEEELALAQAMEMMHAVTLEEQAQLLADHSPTLAGSLELKRKVEMPPPPVPSKRRNKRQDVKMEDNPFEQPPDHDQLRLEDLGCFKKSETTAASANPTLPNCILAAIGFDMF